MTGRGVAADAAADAAVDLPLPPDSSPTPDAPPPDTFSPDVGAGAVERCATAPRVNLYNGVAVVNGTTTGLSDEFPNLQCQGTLGLTSVRSPPA